MQTCIAYEAIAINSHANHRLHAYPCGQRIEHHFDVPLDKDVQKEQQNRLGDPISRHFPGKSMWYVVLDLEMKSEKHGDVMMLSKA
ncbi:CLUMA_CG019349, isoform A [Clunio marinus]|uniref:CLUMA_CG019349, isoform A n=1 Tax=Clunio marinus TaxID=568069 RepID=A0A1J1J2T8_9DIPT|nr:CLUMA_CG019349, isoform A [Clunio marinus]